MKTFVRIFLMSWALAGTMLAGSKPIDYVVTDTKSIMTIAMRGEIDWREKKTDSTVSIVLFGDAQYFIVKRINYNFRDGAIRSFSMAPSHPDTEHIAITLRKNQAYKIYQNPSSKRLNIEFLPVSAAVAAVPSKRTTTAPVKPAPINIAQLAQEQTLEPPAAKPEPPKTEALATVKSSETLNGLNGSALLLLFASFLILVGGGAALAYVFLKRSKLENASTPPLPTVTLSRRELSAPQNMVAAEESDPDFEHAIEYAEQYLRTQGELELQQRLEQLTASSFHTRIEKAVVRQTAKKTNNAAAAQKLGISVGELELATRLRRLGNRQMTEQV